jgi:hypothetical protein
MERSHLNTDQTHVRIFFLFFRSDRTESFSMPQTSEPTKSDEPFANISIVKYQDPISEVIQLGPIRLDVLEDGRNTDQRLGAVYVTLPPGIPGPPQHWHQVRTA